VRRLAGWVIASEPLLLIIGVPLLVLPQDYLWKAQRGLNAYDALGDPALAWPGPLSYLALGLLALPWLARLIRDGHLTRSTPLDLPILVFLASAGLGVWVAPDQANSLNVFLGTLAGVALYYGIWNTCRHSARRIWLVAGLLVLGGAALAAWGFLQTDWSKAESKAINWLIPVHEWLRSLPQLSAVRMHPSAVAGSLVAVIPLAAVLLFSPLSRRRRHAGAALLALFLVRLGLFVALGLMLGYVVVVWSRGDLLALALTLVLMLLLRGPAGREAALGLAVGTAGCAVALMLAWPGTLTRLADMIHPGRSEVWTRALYIIGDHPFTGAGLHSFRAIARNSYPYANPTFDQSEHAHSWPLQAGVDGGLAGVAAVVGLTVLFYRHMLASPRRETKVFSPQRTRSTLREAEVFSPQRIQSTPRETEVFSPQRTQSTLREADDYQAVSVPSAASVVNDHETSVPSATSVVNDYELSVFSASSVVNHPLSAVRFGALAGFTALLVGSLWDDAAMSTPRLALLVWATLGLGMAASRKLNGATAWYAPGRRRPGGCQLAALTGVVLLGLIWLWQGGWLAGVWYNNLGCLARNQGLYSPSMSDPERAERAAQAVKYYEQAIAAAPGLTAAHRNLGVLYYQAAHREETLRYISWTTGLPIAPKAFFEGLPPPEGGYAAAAEQHQDQAQGDKIIGLVLAGRWSR